MLQQHHIKQLRTLAVAASYVRRGWRVVPVPYQSKAPVISGWQNLRISESDLDRYFVGRLQNVGVLLGEPSQQLVDVDLDHPCAVELAPLHLPPSAAIFGRVGKPRSHWIYYSTRSVATTTWRLPNRQMIVELRSNGAQTVFPGSIHESNEPIDWEEHGDPSIVDPDLLQNQLQEIRNEVFRRLNLPLDRDRPSSNSQRLSAPGSVVARARRYLLRLPPAVSGQGGHNVTFRAACALVLGFGLDRDEALMVLAEWNKTCQPPWSDNELQHKVCDALKQPGWRGYLLGKHAFSDTAASSNAIARANRHAIEHRRRTKRKTQA